LALLCLIRLLAKNDAVIFLPFWNFLRVDPSPASPHFFSYRCLFDPVYDLWNLIGEERWMNKGVARKVPMLASLYKTIVDPWQFAPGFGAQVHITVPRLEPFNKQSLPTNIKKHGRKNNCRLHSY
jgi:hypothetical protein